MITLLVIAVLNTIEAVRSDTIPNNEGISIISESFSLLNSELSGFATCLLPLDYH